MIFKRAHYCANKLIFGVMLKMYRHEDFLLDFVFFLRDNLLLNLDKDRMIFLIITTWIIVRFPPQAWMLFTWCFSSRFWAIVRSKQIISNDFPLNKAVFRFQSKCYMRLWHICSYTGYLLPCLPTPPDVSYRKR